MRLEYITCSDMREHNEIDDIINLGLRYPMSEFAIQAHPSKFSGNMPRYIWFDTLVNAAKNTDINLAIHINSEWRTMVCGGQFPYEIKRLLDIKNDNNKPVIGRVQVNINGGNAPFRFYTSKVADLMRAYPNLEFIFQYTPKQKTRIARLDQTRTPFSLLFDSSGGRGILPADWAAPVSPNHKMGYSGGLSPDNIADNLDKINALLPHKYKTWIDAEGKLKDLGKFDVALAERYIQNALTWQAKHSK